MRNLSCKALFILFVCFGFAHAHAHENHPSNSCGKKIYLQPDQVAINEEGIFFQYEGEWIVTDAIHRDGTGLYISSTKDDWSIRWECPKCHYFNSPVAKKCANCNFQPPR